MRKQVKSTKKPGDGLYAKNEEPKKKKPMPRGKKPA
ncbi:hypothetical protein AH02_67 [Pseudomonas phage AH02]|nr:hypothetical protein AH02_67 [Pseudomonas phage AH02]